MCDWISVKDAIPKYGEPVLVCADGVVQNVLYYRDGADGEPDWWQDFPGEDWCIDWDDVSHWMPKPSSPK